MLQTSPEKTSCSGYTLIINSSSNSFHISQVRVLREPGEHSEAAWRQEGHHRLRRHQVGETETNSLWID